MNIADELTRHKLPEDATARDRLVDALAIIETFPERWDQSDWERETECGTAYCLGGWAAVRRYGRLVGVDISEMARLLGLRTTAAFSSSNTLNFLYDIAAAEHGITPARLLDDVAKLRADRGWLAR